MRVKLYCSESLMEILICLGYNYLTLQQTFLVAIWVYYWFILGDVGFEQGERFHSDIKNMKEQYEKRQNKDKREKDMGFSLSPACLN